MERMTDNEIIKALECCVNKQLCAFDEDKFYCHNGYSKFCDIALLRDALDLINRLQAEIEHIDNESSALLADIDFRENEINRLQAQNEVYETCNARKDETIKSLESRLKKLQMQFGDIGKMYSEIKAEAYKEFADILQSHFENYPYDERVRIDYVIGLIRKKEKELVGDDT